MHLRAEPRSQAGARLLLVEGDAPAAQEAAKRLAASLGRSARVEIAASGRSAVACLRMSGFDFVLADIATLGDLDGRPEHAVARLVRAAAGALVMALSDDRSVSTAVAALRAGAHDFLAKPLEGGDFALRLAELARRHGRAVPACDEDAATGTGLHRLHGSSPQMRVVFEQIRRIAGAAEPVFITGEAGTGKELCAEALHMEGPRRGRRFVAVDIGELTPGIIEATLFGAASGAVAGAVGECRGALELADGGTLFLDEIGALDLSLQGKLLRFLQSGSFTRAGESIGRSADVRVVCATSTNPMQLIAEHRFREDLFYRLHVLPLHLPPLRQRAGDDMLLARHFLERFAQEESKCFSGFSGEAAAMLSGCGWPGNVRQLRDLMLRVVVMCEGGEVDPAMLELADVEGVLHRRVRGGAAPLVEPMWRQEQRIIEEAVAAYGGNVALAAAALELSPSTIYRKRQSWAEMDGQRRGAA